MKLPAAAARILAVIIGLAAFGVLAMAGRGVVFGLLRRTATSTPPQLEQAGPPPTAEEYSAKAEAILAPIKASWQVPRFTADVSRISGAKRALMALTVPAEVREWHLRVILALSRVEQDYASEEAHGELFMQLQ